MAQFLYRAAGSPAYTAPTTSPFIDLPTSHTFYKAINWMYDRGITQGVATGGALGYFAANPVNRGAMTAFLKRVQPLLQPGEPQQPPPPPVLPASPCQITLNPGKYQPFCPEDPAVKSWRFIVAEDEAMTKVIQTVVVNKPSTTISNLMEYQSVYQQVQLCTAKEGAGTCTTAWRPQRIDVPGKDWASVDWAQLTQVTPDRVTVQWQPAAGATAYTVEVYSASDRTKVGAFSVKASAACPAKGEEDTPTSLTLNRAQLTGLGAERSFLINVTSSRCASQSKNGTHYPALFQAGFPYAAPGGTAFALTVQSFNALQQSSANQDYDAVAPNPALLHNWSQRVVKLAEQIRSADLVAVQETKWYPEDPGATRGHIQDLAAAAGLTLAMRPDGQGPCNDSSEHFLYNPAKLALTRCGVEAITPDAPRHVAWAEFQDRASGKSVFAANTHTTMDTPDGGPQTVTTIERVLAIVEANNTADRPVILLGDFNADLGQSTSPLGLIARAGYVDTAWVATARSYPNQWLPSRHGFAPVDQTTYHTSVDHIFTNQSIVVNTHQVGYLSPAQAVTDHFSLTAEVSVYS
jgi:endonuclease/exonuclease/phosphatase family metal-dependent hydrolase